MAYKKLKRALIGALIIGASPAVYAADEKPKTITGASAGMLANTCAGCHGTNGASSGPATPTIAGISAVYFEEVMKGFKEGTVKNTIMGRIANGYSDEEIKAMGEHFSKQPFVPTQQPFDEKLADKGAKLHDKYCEKCHADGGSSAEDDSGILLGQLTPYLHYTMSDFKSGDRVIGKKMKKKVNELTKKEGDEGFEALFNFYARGTWKK
jgi:sulfide dehydrogenase cytochrome subunit